MRKTLRSVRFVVATAFRADPWRAAAICALSPALGLTTAGTGLGLKLLADAVAGRRPGVALLAAAALAAAVSLTSIAGLVLARLQFRLQECAGLLVERWLVELAAGLPGLEHHERPEYLDRLEHLRAERATLGQAINALAGSCTLVVQILGTVALLAGVYPALLLLPLFGLPSLFTSARSAKLVDAARHATAEHARLAAQYLAMATSVGPAKELRLFGLREEILRRHRGVGEAAVRTRVRARLAGALWEAAGSMVFLAGYLGAIALIVWRASLGMATPGDILLTLRLASQINGNVFSIAGTTAWLREVLLLTGHFLWFMDYAKGPTLSPAGRRSVPPPAELRQGIGIQHLSFCYPGTSAEILHDVNLYLPAGTVVALVGENGAGKSTLVKLLCGFYQPTQGRITVDGIDLADIAIDEWRANLSGAFQDFCKFEFTAQEAIGVGDLLRINDPARVRCVAEQAGASVVIEALPDGLGTQLGRTFHGVDLSQGQWQKLALARSRMPRQPLLCMLDEPTASLDAVSEHELFSQITDAARETASRGAITLLVSHRLSTVRAADLIVVLRDGKVAEIGTHDDLMEMPGLYAELFTLQSSAYR